MDNLLRLIRQHNIFGTEPTAGSSPNYSFGQNPNNSEEDEYDIGARMNELYHPEHDMTDRYESTLDQMPVRQHPGVWKRLLASAISGATQDPRMGNSVLDGPYNRDLADWTTRLKAIEPAANMERANNTNQRAVANSIISQEQGSRRLERQYSRDRTIERQGDARLRQGDERLADADKRIAQADERLKIAREVANGGQLKVDDNGDARIVRKDGTTIPVKGEYLSFEEKEQAKANHRPTPGANTIKTDVIDDPDNPGRKVLVRINSDNTYTIIRGQGGGKPAEPKSRTETTEATVELGTSRKIANKALEIKNSNPKWSKWIKILNGKPEITRPGMFGMTGPSQEEYRQMHNAIFGGQPRAGSRGSAPPNGKPNTVPAGKVKVKRKSDGATGMMDANDPQLTSGKYERIQ